MSPKQLHLGHECIGFVQDAEGVTGPGTQVFDFATLPANLCPFSRRLGMMDVLWSDLHMTDQSRSSKSGDSFYRPFRTA
jgi:hypothetical protein